MSKSYSSAIEEIKSRCNIVDVISSVVPLKRAGSNYKGLCPFHKEKTPSFIVSESKQRFTCYGCGANGNIFEFVKLYYNIGFLEAVEKIAQQYGIEITDSYKNNSEDTAPYYEINKLAARYFYDAIKQPDNPGLKYMLGRKFKTETIQKFGIGWAEDSWSSLTDYLHSNKISDEQALEISLLSKSDKGRVYDRFRGRVIFPIINTRGKVIGFGGRIIGEGEPKYLNSSESLIFKKKNNLFGLNLTKGEIQSEGYAILVEGYMDVASLYQAGVKNVCASCGTALTQEQAKLLKRFTDKAVLCYDADSAGINAALRGIDILRDAGLDVKVLHVDDGKDPDEYVRTHSADDFRALIKEKAIPDVDYKIMLIKQKYDVNDTTGAVKFLQAAAGVLRKLSPVEAEIYIQKIARSAGISEAALRREVNGQGKDRNESRPSESGKAFAENNPDNINPSELLLEKTLIRLSLLHGNYFEKLKNYKDAFVTDKGNRIFSVLESQYKSDSEFDTENIKESLDTADADYINLLISEIKIGANDTKTFDECIAKLEKMRKEKRKKEIKDMLDMAPDDANPQFLDKLLKEYMDLQK